LGGLIGWEKPIFKLGAQPFLLAEFFKIFLIAFLANKIQKIREFI
jgi:biotin transport system substrate-specific component